MDLGCCQTWNPTVGFGDWSQVGIDSRAPPVNDITLRSSIRRDISCYPNLSRSFFFNRQVLGGLFAGVLASLVTNGLLKNVSPTQVMMASIRLGLFDEGLKYSSCCFFEISIDKSSGEGELRLVSKFDR